VEKSLGLIFPFLLKKGVVSDSKDLQKLSMNQVTKMERR